MGHLTNLYLTESEIPNDTIVTYSKLYSRNNKRSEKKKVWYGSRVDWENFRGMD